MISAETQSLDSDGLVSLFILDTTPIGGTDIYRFTNRDPKTNTGTLRFDGSTYTAIDLEVSGFKWDGKGSFPKPKLRVSAVGGLVPAIINTYGDLVGSKFIRLRTFARHLDDGSDPDPNALLPTEIYSVEQRVRQNNVFVEWQLSSVLDQMGVKLPRRQCLRNVCTHTYRIWNEDTQTFDYENASCPYVGTKYFRETGTSSSNPANDSCGRKLSDCQKRFGSNAQLPTRAFPGIAKV